VLLGFDRDLPIGADLAVAHRDRAALGVNLPELARGLVFEFVVGFGHWGLLASLRAFSSSTLLLSITAVNNILCYLRAYTKSARIFGHPFSSSSAHCICQFVTEGNIRFVWILIGITEVKNSLSIAT